MGKLENWIKKGLPLFSIVFTLIIVFIFIKSFTSIQKKAKTENTNSWAVEDTLNFDGVVTDYSGRGSKSTPIVMSINNYPVIIPRCNLDIDLYAGDTIKKLKGEHKYYLKRNSLFDIEHRKQIDTIVFYNN